MFVQTATIIEVILWNPFQSKSFLFFRVVNVFLPAFFVGLKIIMDQRMVSDCSQPLFKWHV